MSVLRVSLASIVFSALACASVQTVRDPAQFIGQRHPPYVTVTYSDKSAEILGQPRITGDSLFGVTPVGPVGVPLQSVAHITAVQHDPTRTTLAVAAIAVVAAGAVYFATSNHNGSCYQNSQTQNDQVSPTVTQINC